MPKRGRGSWLNAEPIKPQTPSRPEALVLIAAVTCLISPIYSSMSWFVATLPGPPAYNLTLTLPRPYSKSLSGSFLSKELSPKSYEQGLSSSATTRLSPYRPPQSWGPGRVRLTPRLDRRLPPPMPTVAAALGTRAARTLTSRRHAASSGRDPAALRVSRARSLPRLHLVSPPMPHTRPRLPSHSVRTRDFLPGVLKTSIHAPPSRRSR